MSANDSHKATLPTEVIDQIIRYLIPPADQAAIALPPSHPSTKALLAFTRVSRSTYLEAACLLYTRCLYIDSDRRLHQLSITLMKMAGRIPSHYTDISLPQTAKLEPGRARETLHALDPKYRNAIVSDTIMRNPSLPSFSPHKSITSLYLNPSGRVWTRTKRAREEAIATAHSIHDLLALIAPTLRQLIVRLELRALAPSSLDYRGAPTNAIRDAFEQCTNIEFLYSEDGPFYLNTRTGGPWESTWVCNRQPSVWFLWKNLETLIITPRQPFDIHFWHYVRLMSNLKALVLIQPGHMSWAYIRMKWHEAADKYGLTRQLVVLHIEAENDTGGYMLPDVSNDEEILVKQIEVPHGGDLFPRDACQDWLQQKLMSGQNPVDWN